MRRLLSSCCYYYIPTATIFLLLLAAMTSASAYKIGTSGTPWGVKEKQEWFESRIYHRSYHEEVVTKLEGNSNFDGFTVSQYGTLSVSKDKEYPLFVVKSDDWDSNNKPSVLITGGVHGYETSGVQGAILFLKEKAPEFTKEFNILVAPCISPWGYECIERWNSQAVDPNRSFNPNGQVVEGRSFNPEPATDESKALIQYLEREFPEEQWTCHLDLHETTDTDKTEFRPAKWARDGGNGEAPDESIPDGFYLVSDETNLQSGWYTAMIDSVRKVTHIAPSDEDGTIIGERVVQEGVIAIPNPSSLGLCAGVTNAPYATTTEVYPDSSQATPEQCNQAQVACIVGALEYILQTSKECPSSSTSSSGAATKES